MKNTMKTIGLATVTALALVGCGGGGGDTSDGYVAHPYDAPPISESLKNEYLTAVNNARAVGRTCGELGFFPAVPPLVWNDGLYKSAYEHSEDMNVVGYFSHSGSGGASDWTAQVQELGRKSTPAERIRNNTGDSEYGYLRSENLLREGSASRSAAQATNSLLTSPYHCAGIMSQGIQEMGMANVGKYWAQNFQGKS